MALGFGFNSSFGIGDETTFGTLVSPTKFCEINSESMTVRDQAIAKPPLSYVSQIKERFVKSKVGYEGDVTLQLPYTGITEKLLKNAFGASSVSGAGPYTHNITLTSALPTGISTQVIRDNSNIGSVEKCAGVQISKLSLKQEPEDFLMCTASFLGTTPTQTTMTSPSFPATFFPISWEHMTTTTINSVSYNFRSFELTLDNNLAADRYKLGSRSRIGFGRNGQRKINVKATVEYEGNALLTLMQAQTNVQAIFDWDDSPRSFQIMIYGRVMSVKNSADTAGPLMQEVEFECFTNSSNGDELEIELINATAGPD